MEDPLGNDPEEVEIAIYDQVEEVQSIVNTLVESIYLNPEYQDHIKELEESNDKGSTKKVINIKNTFADIRVFGSNTEPLFLATDIGIILGVSNVNVMTKAYTSDERVIGFINEWSGKNERNKIMKKIFLTKHGVYRIIFNNRSKLSEVFRGFIYKLIDHMFEHEHAKLKAIISEFTKENPKLVEEGLHELDVNVKKYKELYEIERRERELIESEKTELEATFNFSEMYIVQLQMEKTNIINRLSSRTYDENLDETNMALEKVKRRYCKEFTISLVSPKMLDEIFSPTRKPPYDISEEMFILNSYKNGYAFLLKSLNVGNDINIEEIYYLYLEYTPNGSDAKKADKSNKISKSAKAEYVKPVNIVRSVDDDYTCIASDYVLEKTEFGNMIDILKEECNHYQISKTKKSYIFRTTIEHIRMIARNLLSA